MLGARKREFKNLIPHITSLIDETCLNVSVCRLVWSILDLCLLV